MLRMAEDWTTQVLRVGSVQAQSPGQEVAKGIAGWHVPSLLLHLLWP